MSRTRRHNSYVSDMMKQVSSYKRQHRQDWLRELET